jgi:predicted acetyltransferase
VPSIERLPSFLGALARGWDGEKTLFGSSKDLVLLAKQDPNLVLAKMADRSKEGVRYNEDGSTSARGPALHRWMWDREFVGRITLRLPTVGYEELLHQIGHIGYETMEWKRGQGYATKALFLMLNVASKEGMTNVELVTKTNNIASERVVTNNGGILIEEFNESKRLGGGKVFRWRIDLSESPSISTSD